MVLVSWRFDFLLSFIMLRFLPFASALCYLLGPRYINSYIAVCVQNLFQPLFLAGPGRTYNCSEGFDTA
jgi:hypothetical protein